VAAGHLLTAGPRRARLEALAASERKRDALSPAVGV